MGNFNKNRAARSRYKRSSSQFKIGGIIATPFLVAALAYVAYATTDVNDVFNNPATGNYSVNSLYNGNTALSYDFSISAFLGTKTPQLTDENFVALDEQKATAKTATDKTAAECADVSNSDGLAAVQAQKIADEKALELSSIDLDKLFGIAKSGGCFDILKSFPDVSVAIPSFSDILAKIQKALLEYATRKVCAVVNDAMDAALSPIADQVANLSSSGQLDLTGTVNKTLAKKYYSIDADLGKSATNATSASTYSLTWDSADAISTASKSYNSSLSSSSH